MCSRQVGGDGVVSCRRATADRSPDRSVRVFGSDRLALADFVIGSLIVRAIWLAIAVLGLFVLIEDVIEIHRIV